MWYINILLQASQLLVKHPLSQLLVASSEKNKNADFSFKTQIYLNV